MRRVDGVLPSEFLSAKYQVAWTRPGRLAFGKVSVSTYTIPYREVPYLLYFAGDEFASVLSASIDKHKSLAQLRRSSAAATPRQARSA